MHKGLLLSQHVNDYTLYIEPKEKLHKLKGYIYFTTNLLLEMFLIEVHYHDIFLLFDKYSEIFTSKSEYLGDQLRPKAIIQYKIYAKKACSLKIQDINSNSFKQKKVYKKVKILYLWWHLHILVFPAAFYCFNK